MRSRLSLTAVTVSTLALSAVALCGGVVLSPVANAASSTATAQTPASISAQLSGTNQITVKWSQPPGAVVSGYELQVLQGRNKTYSLPANVTEFTVAGLTPGNWYSFRVRASIGGKKGPYATLGSTVYVLRAGETAPPVTVAKATPGSLAVSVTGRSVSLSWTAPTELGGRSVKQYLVTATPGPITLTLSGSSFSAGFSDLKADTFYTFSVQGVLSDGSKTLAISSAPIFTGVVTTTAPPTTVAVTAPATTVPPTTAPPTTTTTTLQPLPAVPAVGAIPVSKCISQVWPASVSGRPANFTNGAKRGVYLWFESGVWNVNFYNPSSSAPALFTGSISSSSTQKIYPTYWESTTDLVKAGTRSSSFSASLGNDIDTLRVASPCSRTVTFSFFVNGKAIPTTDVHIGLGAANPLSSTFVVSR